MRRGHLPFSVRGIATVFRAQIRSTRAITALATIGAVACAATVATSALAAVFSGDGRLPDNSQRGLAVWMSAEPVAATIVLLAAAAIGGACAAPHRDEARQQLVTVLAPAEISIGRLLAALAPVLAILAIDLSGWLLLIASSHAYAADASTEGAVVAAHLIQLCAVMLVGGVSMLTALGGKRGRATGRGIIVGLAFSATLVGDLFLANPVIRATRQPALEIEGALVLNPAMAASSAMHQDIVRAPWIYDHAAAAEYDFAYPPPLACAAVSAICAICAMYGCSVKLNRLRH